MKPSAQLVNDGITDNITVVADLIDGEVGCWKNNVIRRNFIAPEADAILNIPLRRGGGEDFLAWSLEKSGVYSVKSAYRALVNHNEHLALDEGTVTGTSTNEEQMWKALWKLNVVPKVRVFWWLSAAWYSPG